MSQNQQSKNSDTVSYTGVDNPIITSPTLQCGGWAQTGTPQGTLEILEGVPAQVKVSISGAGVIQVGAINQSRCQVSLQQGTLQLVGHIHDARNTLTDPAVTHYVWKSRNSKIATVDSSGLVTLIGRGECDIECFYPRSSNAPFANATPSGTEGAYATLSLVVVS